MLGNYSQSSIMLWTWWKIYPQIQEAQWILNTTNTLDNQTIYLKSKRKEVNLKFYIQENSKLNV